MNQAKILPYLGLCLSLAFAFFAAPALADKEPKALKGKWKLVSSTNANQVLGSLDADGRYLTIKMDEPAMDFTAGYSFDPESGFSCLVIDKKVFALAGRLEEADAFDLDIEVKEIGRPEKTKVQVKALRED